VPLPVALEVDRRLRAVSEAGEPAIEELAQWEQLPAEEREARSLERYRDIITILEAMQGQLDSVVDPIRQHRTGGQQDAQASPQPVVRLEVDSPPSTALSEILERWAQLADAVDRALDEARRAAVQLPQTPDLFRDGIAPMLSYQVLPGVVQALQEASSRRKWTDHNGRTAPMRQVYEDDRGHAAYLSFRANDDELSPSPAVLDSLWTKLSSLDDLASDVFMYCLCVWATSTKSPDEAIWIQADRILDERGIKRVKRMDEPANWQHGHRPEDRRAVGRALAQLRHFWIAVGDIEAIPPRKRRKGQYIHVDSAVLIKVDRRLTQHDLEGNEIFLAAKVQPGDWARTFWSALGWQTGLLAQQALSYDPYHQRPEKRLAKYLAFQFRINANHRSPALRRRVSTLLEAVGDAIRVDRERPYWTRDRLEKALTRLQEDGVIAQWEYPQGQPNLPARRWVDQWLDYRISITPPETIANHYALKLRRETPALPSGQEQ
jgi:hypothetical protein